MPTIAHKDIGEVNVDIQIRLIRPDELDALLDLYKHLHPTDAPLPDDEQLEQIWHDILGDPKLCYFVADLGGQLVASCTLAIIPNLTRGARPYGVIENVITRAGQNEADGFQLSFRFNSNSEI